MSKPAVRNVILAVAATFTLALPSAAQAGGRHDDCLHKVFRDVDHSVTRVVHHTGRVLKDMFRWCDRRG